MKRVLWGLLLVALCPLAIAWNDRPYNRTYDPFRDPFVDFETAKRDATAAGKLILIDVGGDWCIWCKRLDQFLGQHPDVSAPLDEVFILLKVNVSEERSNLEFFKQFPAIKGYPHFLILDSKGKYLGGQDTSQLEQGKSYSREKFTEFVGRWRVRKS